MKLCKRTFWVALTVFLLAIGVGSRVLADETKTKEPPPAQLGQAEATEVQSGPTVDDPVQNGAANSRIKPKAIVCKVLVVNRADRTMTVEIDGKLHMLKLDGRVQVLKKGKPVTLDAVLPGQYIVVLARLQPDGVLEVVGLSIGPSKARIQAAGPGKAQGKGRGLLEKSASTMDSRPFYNFPNPANNLGPLVTPNR